MSTNANTRCRPGDLALVIRGREWGKAVVCIELSSTEEQKANDVTYPKSPVWRIDRPLKWAATMRPGVVKLVAPYCPDDALLPLRPSPDEEPEDVREALLGRPPNMAVWAALRARLLPRDALQRSRLLRSWKVVKEIVP
jgi:hypothetical protein